NFVVVDITSGADVIGETSFNSGPPTLHEKAIYIIEGALYQVEKLDFEGRKAFVRQIECDYYTDAITYTRVAVLETFATDGGSASHGEPAQRHPPHDDGRPGSALDFPADPAAQRSHGEVHVTSRVVGFKKIKFYTNENVGSGELDLPEQQMHTTAYWLTVPPEVMGALPYAPDDRRDGVVGLSFAMRQVAQLLLMCDRQDVGISIGSGEQGEETDLNRAGFPAKVSDEPRIFIYDNYPGGIGFSAPLFAMHAALLARTRELIAGCECEHGCPTCVGPIGNTGPLAKIVALRILELIGSRLQIQAGAA
ncbi:MAG TPA: Zn-binding domain-containing protein, partial [Burkholderiales bacterium]|nr:Zn-binding domain-containing protein [Burkholderiales bacterium]